MLPPETEMPDIHRPPLGGDLYWSIGIYRGQDPFSLQAAHGTQPVISRDDVTDIPATFVADPFMVHVDGVWWMFFEVLEHIWQRGEIAVASSPNGMNWKYEGVVLREKFHLSYPHVFQHEGSMYMLPETYEANGIFLYKAGNFPHEWEICAELVKGEYADSTIFRHDGRWWILTCSRPHTNDRLELFFSDSLMGPWAQHPQSPVVPESKGHSRPAGSMIKFDGKLYRLAQDCRKNYGDAILAFEVLEINPTNYREKEIPGGPLFKGSGAGWNMSRMHHADLHQLPDGSWMACTDGYDSYYQPQ